MLDHPPTEGLRPGLADPVFDSQRVFRAVLDALAHPGTIVDLSLPLSPPPPLDLATAAVVLALADYETPLWLDQASATDAVRAYLSFHCGCPLTSSGENAAFAVVTDPAAMPALAAFQAGSDEYPDRSTTLVVQLPALRGGDPWELSGPGIRTRQSFAPAGLPPAFAEWLRANHSLFPRGVDLIFTSGSSLAALPRSSQLEG